MPEVRVSNSSGSVTVIGEERDGVTVEGGKVKIDGLAVKATGKNKGSGALVVRCPEGSDVVIGTRSGSLELRGRLGNVRFTTMSGSLQAEHVGSADIRGMSGSVVVEECDGLCRVKGKSGSLRVGSTGALDAAIGSGSIDVGRVTGAVRARAVSGRVGIGVDSRDRIEAETMSGSITITVPAGCHPYVRAKSLSRSTDVSVPAGNDCEIVCKTLSGGITVKAR